MTLLPAAVRQCGVCGVEYPADALPQACPICVDERQYQRPDRSQPWVDPADFTGEIEISELEPQLWGIDVRGGIGIGQQAKLIVTPYGNVMVEVPAAIAAEAIEQIRALGPVVAIIASHPHMYGVQSLWAEALGEPVVYVAEADQHWVAVPPSAMLVWRGEIEIIPGVTASQPGGHFPGSTVVHWVGADGAGVLLSGDTIAVNADRATVAFMRSYPNRIPLSATVVERIVAEVERYEFQRIYGNFTESISGGAKQAVHASGERHCRWVRGEFDHLT